jgi:hypothetical protein
VPDAAQAEFAGAEPTPLRDIFRCFGLPHLILKAGSPSATKLPKCNAE